MLRWFLFGSLIVLGTTFGEAQTKLRGLPPVTPIHIAELKEMIRHDSGNVVFVNVWATWCKPCREEMPQVVRLRKNFLNKGFSLILVSVDDSDIVGTQVRPALQKLGVNFPSYIINEKSDEAFITGMDSSWNGALPTTFVYDRHGALSNILTGERTYKQFEEAIRKFLRE
ncbi:MAG: TlpA family protein disulfide reductase [Ignavibacteriae bacterium]|nr:TlpA family protein disulfide reductase [Ignavibacteria bacterium]MBI3365483.1 TlpA family protein disulfide reductase [Ignavibacteriota bacterium]